MPTTINVDRLARSVARRTLCATVSLTSLLSCGEPAEPAKHPSPNDEVAEAPPENLPPLTVLQRLRGSETERRACFAASSKPTDGFVKLVWDIDREGQVSDVAIEGTSVHDPAIETCLSKEIAKLDFGPLQVPGRARWTFVHQLPKMPGADASRAKQRKAAKQQEASDEVAGVSIEAASPGSLDLGRIEDIVHAGFPLFAYCYRAGLERDPRLGGLVRLRFVIDEDGAVMGVMDSGSEFGDPSALDCMAEGIFALSFPRPTGGDVRVQYRIVFESG